MTTKPKRTSEQVHQAGGHTSFVAACSVCVTEAEADQQVELARAGQPAEPPAETVAEPLAAEDPAAEVATLAESAPAAASTGSSPTARAGDGRPQCAVPDCVLPEFIEGVGVCGGHYATHRGYATKRSG